MSRNGIYRLSQIEDRRHLKDWLGRNRKISVTLYDQVVNEPDADQLTEQLLLPFSDERGVSKWTCAKRFRGFDAKAIEILRTFFDPATSELSVQDLGISDGRTATEFFEKLADVYPQLVFYASDRDPMVYILEQGNLKVTLSRTNRILEIVWPPFVFNTINRESAWRHPIRRVVQAVAERRKIPPLLAAYEVGVVKTKEAFLVAPATLALSRRDSRFRLERYDILTPFHRQSQVVRVMNLLNPCYFSNGEFERIVTNIYHGLVNDGFLLTGSNLEAETTVHGGIFQKVGSGFRRIWRSGNGSPIESLIERANKCFDSN